MKKVYSCVINKYIGPCDEEWGKTAEYSGDWECPHCHALQHVRFIRIIGIKEHGKFNVLCYNCKKLHEFIY